MKNFEPENPSRHHPRQVSEGTDIDFERPDHEWCYYQVYKAASHRSHAGGKRIEYKALIVTHDISKAKPSYHAGNWFD